MHLRLGPRRHQFRHRAFSLMVDLDLLGKGGPAPRLLGLNRRGLLSVWNSDHGPRDGSPLRRWVDAELARAGEPPAARVLLHAFPRVLGYVFNPISVFFCLGPGGALQSLIYEVKNTYGDQIAYVLPAGEARAGQYRQTQTKDMYVSPFIAMDETYRFVVHAPGQKLALRIRQAGPAGETLIAAHTARGSPATAGALAAALARYPAFTLGVIGWIHWHAFRLWWKGLRWHSYAPGTAFRSGHGPGNGPATPERLD